MRNSTACDESRHARAHGQIRSKQRHRPKLAKRFQKVLACNRRLTQSADPLRPRALQHGCFGALALKSLQTDFFLATVATTVAHRAHPTRSAHVTHRVHAMSSHKARPEAGPVTHTVRTADSTRVASSNLRGTLSMDGRRVLAMEHVRIVRVCRRMV